MIVLRVILFVLGVCGLMSFAAILWEGNAASKLMGILGAFLVMLLGFFLSFKISRGVVEDFFNHEPMSCARKLFLRFCFAVMGAVVAIVFIGKISLESVTLTSLVGIASLFVTALFLFYCAIWGRFPAYLTDSIRRKHK